MNPAQTNSSQPTRVLLADDHPTFRLGLKHIILTDDSFSVSGEAGDGACALAMIRELHPAIAVVDWDMPGLNGLELTKRVRAERLATQIIILTMHDDESLVNGAMDAGVSGFVLKDNAIEDILEGLCAVRDGEIYLSPAVSNHVLKRIRRKADLLQTRPGLESLTATEQRVLAQVASGRTNKEIATDLFISPRTVETHRRNICDKLDLHGSHSLMQFALEHRDLL